MTYKSISKFDPWRKACPKLEDLLDEEVIALLDNADYAPLTMWEQNFCEGIKDWLDQGLLLTDSQEEVLKQILPILWDNDPALWGSYKLMLMDITVDFDKVLVAGVEVPKPTHVGASEWLAFWEAVSEHDPQLSDTLREELEDARKEIKDLENEIRSLLDQRRALEDKIDELAA